MLKRINFKPKIMENSLDYFISVEICTTENEKLDVYKENNRHFNVRFLFSF